MTLDPLLIGVLACPEDKGPLLYFADEDRLYNPRLHRSYDVREGIPVMLIDEATAVDPTEHDRLMAKADAGGSVSTGGPAGS
ncbi:MAG TPA: Trm112 family protein [Acidimicrobiales bacterium]